MLSSVGVRTGRQRMSRIFRVFQNLYVKLIASAAAYVFTRIRPRGSRVIFAILLAGIMIPAQVAVVPIFVVMRNLHLINQLASVWLPALINVVVLFPLCQYIYSMVLWNSK